MKSIYAVIAAAVVTVLVSWSVESRAEDTSHTSHTYLTLPVGSYHFSRNKDWREWNPGVGLEYAHNDDWSVVGGTYLNSHDRRTNYLGGAWYPIHFNS